MKPLQALSLFSGAGGLDIGVRKAGFKILSYVENDPFCCETLRHNLKSQKERDSVIEEDVRNIDPKSLIKQTNLKQGNLDLLFGGPPCQSFSQIGKKLGLDDARGLLLFQMVRFATIFRPKVILIEQVKGILSARGNSGNKGEVIEQLLKKLDAIGYHSKWKVLNSADYGVPQTRKRVFLVATRDTNSFLFPAPTHEPGDTGKQKSIFNLPKYRTVGDALHNLNKPPRKNGKITDPNHIDVTPDGDIKRIKGVPEGQYLAAQAHLPKSQRGRLTIKDTTKYLRLSRNRPSNTLRGGEIFFHPTQDRYLTPRENMRIHGYPDDYQLQGPIRSRSGRARFLDQHRQIGNSVPPPLAKVVAETISQYIYAHNL